ncbi:ABC transporter permease [Roseivirga sp.]|uniref:ABC transporter permease n=1 Tax=Roseivirga sp. TaxID=1964215 RepID=UPI003B8D0ECD
MKYSFNFALKTMLRNKLITLGSLTSMVVGILSVFLIYIWVDNELSTDRFHENSENLYLTVIQQSQIDRLRMVSGQLDLGLNFDGFPEVKKRLRTTFYTANRIKLIKNEEEFPGRGLVSDSTFFDFFDFEVLVGDKENVLKDPTSIILTETTAKRIYGEADPIGETLYLETDQTGYYQVRAIMKDIPSNSSISFDFIVPSHAEKFWARASQEFLLMENGFDKEAFAVKIEHLARKNPRFKESVLSITPFKDIYFNNQFTGSLFVKFGDIEEVNILILVALVVLLVSVFNFSSLQITLGYAQLKVRGIKQVNGADALDFLKELIVNRIIYATLCISLSFGIFKLIKPGYLGFLEISQNFSTLEVVATLTMGVLAFITMSTVFTAFKNPRNVTAQALRGALTTGKAGRAGKILTTVQYVFAITLIIVTSIVYKQFSYMQSKDLGYKPSNVVAINYFERIPYNFDNPEETRVKEQKQVENYQLVKNELSKIPGVISFSQGPMPIDGYGSNMPWRRAKSDFKYSETKMLNVDPRYLDVLDFELLEGRFFDENTDDPLQPKLIINQAAKDYWNIENIDDVKAVGSGIGGEGNPFQIIGVTNNFHFEHLSSKVMPMVMIYLEHPENQFIVKLRPDNFQSTIGQLELLFDTINPNKTFEYTLLENKLLTQYKRERKLSQIFMIFTLTGLIISSIGLFTFALYETRKRIKEIGIRKVIGANVQQVVGLLSVSFVKWVLLAFLIACPLAWFFMNSWLNNFAAQTSLDWWLFVGAGLLTLVLALMTVIGQTYMAAKQNPIESLRYE